MNEKHTMFWVDAVLDPCKMSALSHALFPDCKVSHGPFVYRGTAEQVTQLALGRGALQAQVREDDAPIKKVAFRSRIRA